MKKVTVLKGLSDRTRRYTMSRGFVENLSTYRQNAKKHRFDRNKPVEEAVLIKEELAFDIERHFKWKYQKNKPEPFTYSMMIDSYFPLSFWPWRRKLDKPTEAEFRVIASQLEGFVLEERFEDEVDYPNFTQYTNPDRNIFMNWDFSNSVPKTGRDRIGIGVIQEEPISNLQVVVTEIVPYAVSIFNQLSPTQKISQELMERVIDLAIERDAALSYDTLFLK